MAAELAERCCKRPRAASTAGISSGQLPQLHAEAAQALYRTIGEQQAATRPVRTLSFTLLQLLLAAETDASPVQRPQHGCGRRVLRVAAVALPH